MDLADILKKTQAKSERVTTTRKRASIATEDRPYSIADSKLFQPTFDQTSSELQNVFNTGAEGTVNPLVTQNALRNYDNSIKEIDNKAEANKTQHKPDTNYTQKPNTNSTQSEHEIIIDASNITQTTHKLNTKLNTPKTQSRYKPHTNLTQTTHISALIGIQRKMLLFLFDECKKARSRITEPLSIIHISQAMEIPTGSIKTSISRLCEKQFIKISSFKNGRGGWSSYEIPDATYKELLQMETQHKLHTNYLQTKHKVDTQPNTQLNTNGSSSSSVLNIKETTTQLDNEWNFDITPYSKFGFMTSQLKQLASLGVISAIEVEQSLLEFNHDLDNNTLPQMNTGKINFLMGILRKGQPYVSDSYRNEEEAIISEMATRAESRRKKILEDKFVVWETSLNDEERKKIEDKIPLSLRVMFRTHGVSSLEVKNWLFNYYLQSTT
jgi:hypothetical protein